MKKGCVITFYPHEESHEGLGATVLQFRLMQKCLEFSKYQDIRATGLQFRLMQKCLKNSK